MITSNFHTHTFYCDGKDKPEDMVLAAIRKGFTSLGFSGHSFNEPDIEFAMNESETAQYKKVVAQLKHKYADKINIFCGIEQDYFSSASIEDYDYVIGSVHHILKNGEYRAVDESPQLTAETVNELYNGDYDAYAEDYFELVSDVVNKTKCDIIGHFDLVSKYSEINGYAQSNRYLKAAEKAVEKLVNFHRPFEINTGAMARGMKSVPYPSSEILHIIKANGGTIMFSSDCHNKDYLDYAFDKAENLAKSCGFTKYGIFTPQGIKYIDF